MLKERRLTYLAISAIVLMLMVTLSTQHPVAADVTISDTMVDLTGMKVAIYYGTSLVAPNASREALIEMYEWMGAEVTVLDTDEIKDGALDDDEYQILAVPGANPITMNNDLRTIGRDNIREWICRGGSYFGVCGGAMLASRKTDYSGDTTYFLLKLWNGTVKGPLGEVSGMTPIDVNTTCGSPDLSGESATYSSNYAGGGYYEADEGQDTTILATYNYNGGAALICSEFGTGTVCLSAFHVEIEENSDRDGTSFYDSLDDPDSEWDLMKTISIWQIEYSVWVAYSCIEFGQSWTSFR